MADEDHGTGLIELLALPSRPLRLMLQGAAFFEPLDDLPPARALNKLLAVSLLLADQTLDIGLLSLGHHPQASQMQVVAQKLRRLDRLAGRGDGFLTGLRHFLAQIGQSRPSHRDLALAGDELPARHILVGLAQIQQTL